jgi:hypothetical protein
MGAAGMNFRGAWSQNMNYAVNDAVTFAGSTYLALSAGANAEPDTQAQAWAVLAQGGAAGPTGAAGSAATVSVGTVTTVAAGLPAAVTNSGTAQAAVLNFAIPQGAAGSGGSGGSGGGGVGSGSFAAMYHPVSYNTNYYAVNTPNASLTESGTSGVLAWVPVACSATQLSVYSQQSQAITVTLRVGTPAGPGVSSTMAATALSCTVGTNASCTATEPVAITAGEFVDYQISSASSTPAGVWTALQCQ